MLALVHNILPPYRVPLFNAISEACHGEFLVLLTRETHGFRRSWRVPKEDIQFRVRRVRTIGFHLGERAVDLSFGVGAALTQAAPDTLVVAGWDLHASWSALAWARRRGVPAYAWVESGASSGALRGSVSTRARRLFLRQCRGAIVPGVAVANFVRELAPDMPWYAPMPWPCPSITRRIPSTPVVSDVCRRTVKTKRIRHGSRGDSRFPLGLR